MANTQTHINHIIGKLYNQMKRAVIDTQKKTPLSQKNIILYTGAVYQHMIDAIRAYEKKEKRKFRIGLIYDEKTYVNEETEVVLDQLDLILSCNTNSHTAIQETLLPYQNEILVVTCRGENYIPLFTKILPQIPYVEGPTTESIIWATDKINMRHRIAIHSPQINPAFTVVTDASRESLEIIEKEVGFPAIVKPSGLAASRLVSICFHKEELEEVLKRTFKKFESVYKETHYEDLNRDPSGSHKVLVEHFMEGDMYSIDVYINHTGDTSFCPMVHVKTGRNIGFDDFFGYQQLTPTKLNEISIEMAQLTAAKAIRAVGLRSATAHIEMMKTEDGWKIIEMGPRIGGFRHMMYEFTFDINHTMNDIFTRVGEHPVIPKKQKGYSVAMKFFAKEEGKLLKLSGVKKAQELKSFKIIYVHKKIGDQCTYAKNGGSSVFDIIMFNKDRSDLLADIRRLEQMIDIKIE